MQNNKRMRVFIVAGIIIAVGGYFLGKHVVRSFSEVATDDAYIEGRVHMIAPKIAGTVQKLNVSDNQKVKKGDVLLQIDPVDYELKINEAQASLDAERARLQDVEAALKAASTNVEIQEVTLAQATLDKQRTDVLYKEQVVTKERFEKMNTAYALAVAQVKAAKEQWEKIVAAKKLQESVIKQKETAVEIARRNLGYTKIVSPADGYVTRKAVEEGNQVQPNQALMAVVALDDTWIVANYKETQLKRVKPGQSVKIKVDTYEGVVFTGKVDSIMAGTGASFSMFPPENALGNYVRVVQRVPVKIIFDKSSDNRHTLRIGMSCIPTIITENE